MRIDYGGYQFTANGFRWKRSETLLMQNGIGYARVMSVAVEGLLPVTGTNDAKIKSAALTAATRQAGRDLYLRADNGSIIEGLTTAGALIPVQCVAGPTFAGESGAEMVNYRDVSMTFQATYPTTTGVIVVESVSTLDYTMPFPTIVWMPSQNGPAQRQQTTGNMPGRMVQSGTVVTRNGEPPTPYPLWPTSMYGAPPRSVRTQRLTPYGPEYMLNYAYIFESVIPF